MTAADHALAKAAIREAIDLHGFFEAWLGGGSPSDDATFARLEAALAPAFTMVTPEGRRLARATVIDRLRQAHGAKGQSGPFRIAIRDVETLHVEPPLVALGYVEEQDQGGARSTRRATALFREEPQAPHGVHWLALHETWEINLENAAP
jgi:hypothetical protein